MVWVFDGVDKCPTHETNNAAQVHLGPGCIPAEALYQLRHYTPEHDIGNRMRYTRASFGILNFYKSRWYKDRNHLQNNGP